MRYRHTLVSCPTNSQEKSVAFPPSCPRKRASRGSCTRILTKRQPREPTLVNFPGFRVALAIASLPGMTIELFSERRRHHSSITALTPALSLWARVEEGVIFVSQQLQCPPNQLAAQKFCHQRPDEIGQIGLIAVRFG